ncbi:unnamed protein product, partial [Musa textilis]
MTPDEADAVVIGFSSPENLPTIANVSVHFFFDRSIISSWMRLSNYHINPASTHLPAISS